MEYMNADEIARCAEGARATLSSEPIDVAISDAITNLLILATEEKLDTAEAVVRGAAAWLATYMEGMEPDDAFAWLSDALFPWTGEREFAEYVADQAIVKSGHAGRVATPEWGI